LARYTTGQSLATEVSRITGQEEQVNGPAPPDPTSRRRLLNVFHLHFFPLHRGSGSSSGSEAVFAIQIAKQELALSSDRIGIGKLVGSADLSNSNGSLAWAPVGSKNKVKEGGGDLAVGVSPPRAHLRSGIGRKRRHI